MGCGASIDKTDPGDCSGAKAELIGRPLHEVAAVQKQFG